MESCKGTHPYERVEYQHAGHVFSGPSRATQTPSSPFLSVPASSQSKNDDLQLHGPSGY